MGLLGRKGKDERLKVFVVKTENSVCSTKRGSMSLNNRGVFLGEPRLDLGEEADFWAGLRDINILDFLNGCKLLKP